MKSRLPAVALCVAMALGPATALRAAPPAAAASPAETQPALDELMRLLAARKHGHVSFTEVHVLAIMQRPLESSGELTYDAPDRLEKRTLEPRPETLALAGGVLTIHRGGRTRTLELAQHPEIAPWAESIRATLAGDRAALERYFHVTFSGSLAHWTLLLVPREPARTDTIAAIHIRGDGAALRTLEIRQTDGDHSVLTIGSELTP
jgi:Outer membrane lipoprotein carrier protein LolA-like